MKLGYCAAGLSAALVASAPLQQVLAQGVEPGVELYVGTEVGYDSNFFRVDEPSQQPAGTAGEDLEDTLLAVYAGIDAVFEINRRNRFMLNGVISENTHDEFDAADFTGGEAQVKYDFRGDANEFSVSYDHVEERVDFSNQNNPRIDFRTRQAIKANVRRRLSLGWSAGLGAGFTDIEFEQAVPVERQNAVLDLTYRSRLGNRLAFVADYQERRTSAGNAFGFDEFKVGPEVDWQFASELRLRIAVKYQEREPVDPQLAPYDDIIGDLRLLWTVSPKLEISAGVYRKVSSLGDQLSNFAIVDGQTLGVEWRPADKLRLFAGFAHELRDFEEEPSAAPPAGVEVREDDLYDYFAGLEWTPREAFAVEFTARAGNRDSNRVLQSFDYESIFLNLRWYFLRRQTQ